MAAGRPLIVFDHGWYSEIPEEAALKIAVRDRQALLAAMLRLAQSPPLRQEMGEAGQRYTREFCHPAAVAGAYQQALSATLGRILETI